MCDLGLELRVAFDIFIEVFPQPRLAVEKLCHRSTGLPAFNGIGEFRLEVVPLFSEAFAGVHKLIAKSSAPVLFDLSYCLPDRAVSFLAGHLAVPPRWSCQASSIVASLKGRVEGVHGAAPRR